MSRGVAPILLATSETECRVMRRSWLVLMAANATAFTLRAGHFASALRTSGVRLRTSRGVRREPQSQPRPRRASAQGLLTPAQTSHTGAGGSGR
jgi:hypothetical protein